MAAQKNGPSEVRSPSGDITELFASFPALPFHDAPEAAPATAEAGAAPRHQTAATRTTIAPDAVLTLVAAMRASRTYPH